MGELTEQSTSESARLAAPGYRAFLFSDLRGYTSYVERHGDHAAAELLARYRELVRTAIARYEGAEIRTEGDSFYVVFSSAASSVLCGLAIAGAAAAARAQNQMIEVGIGIHAGEAVEANEGFVGQAVNIAARVCAQAASGEVLVTDIVRGLTRTSVAAHFVPRGRRRLKGIAEPIFLFQAEGPDAARQPRASRRRTRPSRAALAAVVLLGLGGLAMLASGFRPWGQEAGALAPGGASSSLIAFVDTETETLWAVRGDGSALRRLTPLSGIRSAAFSADASLIVVARARAGGARSRLELLDAAGRPIAVLTDDPAFDDRSPAWSPDGLAIVFVRTPIDGGAGALHLINLDGSQLSQLTAPVDEGHDLPDWSPDGSTIAFTVFGGTIATGFVSPDCAGLRVAGGNDLEEYGPAWAPDGALIAFTGVPTASDASTDVYVMGRLGSNATPLAAHPASDRDPAWSPDGSEIAFVSYRTFADEIHVMNADGSEVRQVTHELDFSYGSLSWIPEIATAGASPETDPSGEPPGLDPDIGAPAMQRPTGDCPASAP